MKNRKFHLLSVAAALLLIHASAIAQSTPNPKAEPPERITTIILSICSLIGIIGAFRVYFKWKSEASKSLNHHS